MLLRHPYYRYFSDPAVERAPLRLSCEYAPQLLMERKCRFRTCRIYMFERTDDIRGCRHIDDAASIQHNLEPAQSNAAGSYGLFVGPLRPRVRMRRTNPPL